MEAWSTRRLAPQYFLKLQQQIIINMPSKQNLNPALPSGECMMKRRRGRPHKAEPEENDDENIRRTIKKTARYNPVEWQSIEHNMRHANIKDYSYFARNATMGMQLFVIDSEAIYHLRAARKDIMNFANAIKGMKLTNAERRQLLLSLPTLKEWWPKLETEINGINKFFDYLHGKGFVSLI